MSEFKAVFKEILPIRFFAFIFQIFSIVLSLGQPLLIGVLLDSINNSVSGGNFHELTRLTIILVIISILDFIVYYLKDFLFSKALYRGINLMRNYVLSLALNQPYSTMERNNVGDKLNKILNDSELYAKYIVYQIPNTIIILIRIITIYIILLNMSVALTGLLVVIFLLYLFMYLGINKKIRPHISSELSDYSNVMNLAQETMEGFESIKINVEEGYFKERFSKSLNKYLSSKIKVQRYSSFDSALLNFFYSIIPISILGAGAYFIINGNITLGILIAFHSYTHWIIEPVYSLANLNRIRQQAIAALPRLKSFVESSHLNDMFVKKEKLESVNTLDIENLSFGYDNSKIILNNLSLRLEKGSRIAITGESGSGKSTLAKILLGLIKANSGSILINGIPIESIDLKSYLQQCSYMPQDIFLFSETLEDNIIFGKDKSCISQNMLEELSLLEIINRNIKDIEELSGGEKQRVGIARSMHRFPSLLIYDEPTAALDENMEESVINAIDKYLKLNPCILIVITHRKSILNICDKELHLAENGKFKISEITRKY